MAKKALAFTGSLLALIAGALAGVTAFAAEPDMFDGQWHYSLTPYVWIVSLHGTAYLPLPPPLEGRTVDADITSGQIFSNLKFGAMLGGEARKGDWSIATDLLYARIGASKSTVNQLTGPGGAIVVPTSSYINASVDLAILGLVGGYNLMHNSYGTLDVIAGVRYAETKTSASLTVRVGPLGAAPSPSNSKDLTDGIVGIMGEFELSDSRAWYLPYEFDIGGKSGNVTDNALAGVGYRMSWGNVLVGYRYLKFRFSDNNVQDLRFNGPAIGATFFW